MKSTGKRTTLALALAASLIGSATWSDTSHACPAEPLVSSVCIMSMVNWGDFGGGMYALADGRLLSISQNAALYSLVGTTYGGNGTQTFGIPDLRGRVVMGSGQAPGMPMFRAGEQYGQLTATLTTAQLPAHSHTLSAVRVDTSKMTATTTLSGLSASVTGSLALKGSSGGTPAYGPAGASLATTTGPVKIYSDAAPTIAMNAASIDSSGLTVGNFTGTPTTTLGGTASLSGATDITGASQSVSLMQPSLVLNYYIAVTGIYPMRN
jgi:microcystin-dependent protein